MHHVRLLLDVAIVLGFRPLVAQALLMAVQHDVVGTDAAGNVSLAREPDGLFDVAQVGDVLTLTESLCQFHNGLLAHAVDNEVGSAVAEDAGAQLVFPVVVVGETAQRGFDAAQYDRHVGIELLENLGIDDGGILGPHVVTTVGRVGIFGAQPSGSRIFVDHRVHASRGDAEEQSRPSQFLEVTKVAVPVGLRHDGYAESLRLERASDDGSTEGRMINVGIARKQNDVYVVPSAQLQFLLGGWKKVGQSVLHAFS